MLDEERQESVLIIIFLSLVPEEVAHLPQPLPSGYEWESLGRLSPNTVGSNHEQGRIECEPDT